MNVIYTEKKLTLSHILKHFAIWFSITFLLFSLTVVFYFISKFVTFIFGFILIVHMFNVFEWEAYIDMPNVSINNDKNDVADDIYEDVIEDKICDHNVLSHVLLYGGAGQGKTALAKVLANELERIYGHSIRFIKVSPSQLQSKRQLDEVMLDVVANPYCILFIDEIHGMSRVIEESLYPALQDGKYDITLTDNVEISDDIRFVIQRDRGVQTIDLPKFTCIGATTLIGEINKPLRDRFPIAVEMNDYTKEELSTALQTIDDNGEPMYFDEYIGQDNAKRILKYHLRSIKNNIETKLSPDASELISKISFNTMRVAKQYKKNSIVISKAKGKEICDVDDVKEMMKLYGVDDNGLTRPHLAIIKALLKRYINTPEGRSYSLGSRALANIANVTKSDVDEIYIPMLTKAGIVQLDGRSMKQLTIDAINKYKYLLEE